MNPIQWRPENWNNPHNLPQRNYFPCPDTKKVYEDGADAILQALQGNSISVLSFGWAYEATKWADERGGMVVFVPNKQ